MCSVGTRGIEAVKSAVPTAGTSLGHVRQVTHTGGQNVLLFDGPHGEAMLPFVEPLVVSVDLSARLIICDPPEGLLELNVPTTAGHGDRSPGGGRW